MGAHRGRCFRARRRTAKRHARQNASPQIAQPKNRSAADAFLGGLFEAGSKMLAQQRSDRATRRNHLVIDAPPACGKSTTVHKPRPLRVQSRGG